MQYAKLEPFGEMKADLRSAFIVQMLANINRDSKKYPDGFKLYPIYLQFTGWVRDIFSPKQVQTWQEKKALVVAFVKAWNQSLQRRERKKKGQPPNV